MIDKTLQIVYLYLIINKKISLEILEFKVICILFLSIFLYISLLFF